MATKTNRKWTVVDQALGDAGDAGDANDASLLKIHWKSPRVYKRVTSLCVTASPALTETIGLFVAIRESASSPHTHHTPTPLVVAKQKFPAALDHCTAPAAPSTRPPQRPPERCPIALMAEGISSALY